MLVYVHYYITGQILAICFCHGHCAVSLPCAASHIIGNYNYLCSVFLVVCAYCVTWRDA